MNVEINIERLNYLLEMFKIPIDEFLLMISKGLKNPLKEEDVFSSNIKLSVLKKIDKVFNKGLNFYFDPNQPIYSKEASIFFRKTKFDSDLSIGARQIVNHFEELKISISAISKLADIIIERKLPVFNLRHNPKEVADHLRGIFKLEFKADLKEFLIGLISKFADYNILVFEFVETWNKTEKANIDGFFLNPNVIVLKRQQIAFRREIFTLIHELGHYLLNEEEIDQLELSDLANQKLSDIEKWCNDFAFYFLIGGYYNSFSSIRQADSTNDYYTSLITEISKRTHLSKIAIYTRLLLENRISPTNYNIIKANYEEQYRIKLEEDLRLKELKKLEGEKSNGRTPKPINSPLLISTLKMAYYEGVISEYDYGKILNIPAEKLEYELQ